ncbi:MAG: nucleotidyltransferase domain-containing protein [Deltaproteobacteria bacterium]|nr:nucleotidyltransferase domain-containing protein [Deltaproteobacteria bacterium]
MTEQDNALMLEFKQRLSQDTRRHLRKLIVFGSRATGQATEDSDLDVVALVDDRSPEIESQLDETAYRVMWEHDFRPIISLKVFSEAQFNAALNQGFSFYKHVAREGISV